MNTRKKGRRLFCTLILFFMTLLAARTAALAANQQSRGSYDLIIKKELAEGSPEEAKNQIYEFEIQGKTGVKKDDGKIDWEPIDTIYVQIKGGESEKVTFDGPTRVTITEVTDNIQFTDKEKNKWIMSSIEKREVKVSEHGKDFTIYITATGKGEDEDGEIKIKRPDDAAATTYFKVTGREFLDGVPDINQSGGQGKVIYEYGPTEIQPGGEKVLTGLPQGLYTIEELKAPDGFSVRIDPSSGEGESKFISSEHFDCVIAEDEEGITIGKLEGDDGGREYTFLIKNNSDDTEQPVKVKAGESVSIKLKPDSYSVSSTDDQYAGFELTYKDSSTLLIDHNSPTVTFVNTFAEGEGSYRIIHEYYKKVGDHYEYEGSSAVKTINGLWLNAEYTVFKNNDAARKFDFGKYRYITLKSPWAYAYGHVEPIAADLAVAEQSSERKASSSNAVNFEVEGSSNNALREEKIIADDVKTVFDKEKTFDETASATSGQQIFDENGIIGQGIGKGSKNDVYQYQPDTTMEHVTTTSDGSEIIILRYVRVPGAYKVVHEYYREEADGTLTLEGTSDIGEMKVGSVTADLYRASPAMWEKNFDGRTYNHKEDVYGKVIMEESDKEGLGETNTVDGQTYGMDSKMTEEIGGVLATEKGNQTIILRYVRVPGSYNVVHEYYLEKSDGTLELEGISDLSSNTVDTITNTQYKAEESMRRPDFDGRTYNYKAGVYGKIVSNESEAGNLKDIKTTHGQTYGKDPNMSDGVLATKKGDQVIILRYVRTESDTSSVSGAYNIVHEYYLEKSDGTLQLEGISDITSKTVDSVTDASYKANESMWKPAYNSRTYSHREDAYGRIVPDKSEGENLEDIKTTAAGETYGKDPNMSDGVQATEKGDQIIILRYVRTEPVTDSARGAYSIVHEYYLEKQDGTLQLEGISDITCKTVDPVTDALYKADESMWKLVYNSQTYSHREDVYGKIIPDKSEGQNLEDIKITAAGETYGKDPNMTGGVQATEKGDQIIILRYVRTEPVTDSARGAYSIVHEYYLEKSDGTLQLEGISEITSKAVDPVTDALYKANESMWKPAYNSQTYSHREDVYGKIIPDKSEGQNLEDIKSTAAGETYGKDPNMSGGVQATEKGDQIIILRYVRTIPSRPSRPGGGTPDTPNTPASGSYKVVHEYYLRDDTGDHFEGRSGIATIKKNLGDTTYTADGVNKITVCEANGMSYVYGTSAYGHVTGDTSGDGPTVQVPGDSLYSMDPEMTWVKATENGDQIIILKYYRTLSPEQPQRPELPELPDPNSPDSPDTVTITEGDVPTTYVKVWNPETEEFMYIPEDEVPLWGLPKTGDRGRLFRWALLSASSLGIFLAVWFLGFRKRED